MKILQLQRALRHDVVAQCHPTVKAHAHQTLRTLEARFEKEGFPFLDKLGEAYKAALSGLCRTGNIPDVLPHLGPGFGQVHRWGPHAHLVFLACLSWPSKLTFAGQSQGLAGWSEFKERSLGTAHFTAQDWETLLPMSGGVRKTLSRLVTVRDAFGRHGPGATAERLIGWDKWLALDQPTRPVIRMTSVPKDRLKRRLIGIEHAKMQFVQQGLAASLRATEWFRRWVTLEDQRQHIAFAARDLGRVTSWGDPMGVCTIDLKDASDRISVGLVEYLLPELFPSLACASSSYAQLPAESGGELIPLGMMATMGNGFCFELETLVFHIVASLCGRIYDDASGLGVCHGLEHYASRVRVYGDDVIAPIEWFPVIEKIFAQLGWIINDHKTAVTPGFLETCGTYITPQAHVKRFCPTLQTVDVSGRSTELAWETEQGRVSTALAALRSGLHHTCSAIGLPVLAKASYRWNHQFQRSEIKLTGVVEDKRPLSVTDEIRLWAYWVTNLTSHKRREEGLGTFRVKPKWIPWDVVKFIIDGNYYEPSLHDQRYNASRDALEGPYQAL